MQKGSHNSVEIVIPSTITDDDPFANFASRLGSTITACREMGKASLWIRVPMQRASLIEAMVDYGLEIHHAVGHEAVLNLWLRSDATSKIPDFATHNIGVGGVVVNSRNEILCVRELRQNYLPWKTPTGLSELGETIDDAVEREVLEETGIQARFHSILSFRQTHGLVHGRSDLYFVCRLDSIEQTDDDGNVVIPQPVAQECEIASAKWVPLEEYRDMVFGRDGGQGHPMMQHVLDVLDAERRIEQATVNSVVPGRPPNAIYYPV